jgi:hypothetical protein
MNLMLTAQRLSSISVCHSHFADGIFPLVHCTSKCESFPICCLHSCRNLTTSKILIPLRGLSLQRNL